MAVLGKLVLSSAERLDLSDLLSVDSYTAGDFKYLIKSFVGDEAYILKGFDVIDPSGSMGTESCSVRIADSVMYFPGSNAGAFYYGLPEGNVLSQPLTAQLRRGSLTADQANYIYLTLSTTDQSPDSRAFWDPDKNGGEGGEFSQEVNTESVLTVVLNTSVSSFPTGTIPVAIVYVDSTNKITSIQDCRNMMFRLGGGGATPTPYATYDFRPLPAAGNARLEPSTVMAATGDPNPFQGGDKNIYSLKEWMDAVMTKLLELSGTTFWYQQSPNISITSVFQDALGSTLKSKGSWQHDAALAGKVTWTSDIIYKSVQDPRDIIIRKSFVQLANEQVAYINLTRNADINSGPSPVSFFNGLNYVNGVLNSFQYLKKGDWIKKKVDTDDKYLRVEEFYDAPNAGGMVTGDPTLALSIKLSAPYAGSTATTEAVYTKGEYRNDLGDIDVVDRNDIGLQNAGGNLFWLVSRSDVIIKAADFTTTTVTGSVTFNDGASATINATAHGLVSGDRITLVGTLAGTYIVEVIDVDNFTINVSSSGTGAVTGYYAICTATTRTTANGFELEDSTTGFEANELVSVDGAGAYNGTYEVNPRSTSTFQFAVGAAHAVVTTGTATAVRVDVRKPFGSLRIVQGESVDIGEADGENIQSFIGMTSLSETHPTYSIPGSYNALHGKENFNSLVTDNLTARVSKLTAMMADRVQDRGLRFRGPVTLTNTTSGADQVIAASNTIAIDAPELTSHVVTLGCTLPANSAAVATINRNSSTAISVTVESIGSSFLLDENKFIMFYRLTGSEVYAWDNHIIPVNGSHTIGRVEHSQNKNIATFYPAEVKLDIVVGSPTENRLFFADTDADLTIVIPGSTSNNSVDTSAVMGGSGITLLDGQAVWVRVDRQAAKVFNTVATVDGPDTVGAGKVYVTAKSAVPSEQDVFVLYERVGNALLGIHNLDQLQENIYEEILDIVASPTIGDPRESLPVLSGTTLTLPPDSRDFDDQQYYVVGSGQLELYLNGQMLFVGRDYTEVAGFPVATISSQIIILQDLVIGDYLTYRIASKGSVYFANNNAVAQTLQDGYNAGRFIATSSGQPVVISGPVGEKLLHVAGDMQVDGVIDPKGITFTPEALVPLLSSQQGLWVNSLNELIYQKTSLVSLNINTDFIRRDGTLPVLANLDMGGFKLTNLGAPTDLTDAVTKTYADGQISSLSSAYLRLDGTNSMGADINAGTHKVVNVVDPTLATDAATKNYVDSNAVFTDGTKAMAANLDMATHKIVNLVDPVDPQDAATKNYIDQPASRTSLAVQVTNNTGSLLPAGTIVRMSTSGPGEVAVANASTLALSEGSVGTVIADIAHTQQGYIQLGGEAYVLGGPFNYGRRVYVSASVAGNGTNLAPTSAGQVVFFLGVATNTNTVLLSPNLDAINDNVYDETIDYIVDVVAGTPITLPLDTRNSNNPQTYVVGEGLLEVYLNGQYLRTGDDWSEVGAPETNSTTAVLNQDIKAGDYLTFRINIQNSAYFMSASGSGGSLQTAYNNGRFITTGVGSPVTIQGPAGEKLLHVVGDMQVDGVIDPTGMTLIPQASSPLPLDKAGIWVDSGGNFMVQAGDNAPATNFTAAITQSTGAESITAGVQNQSGAQIDKGMPVTVDANGEMVLVDVSNENEALATLGVTSANVPHTAFGTVVTHGAVKGIVTTATFGDVMWIAKDGTLTNIKPTLGDNGFVALDFVIKVGTLVRDGVNPSQKNLIVNLQVMGQL